MGDIKTVDPQDARRPGRALGWFFDVSALGAAGMLLSLSALWGALCPKAYLPALAALIGWPVCAAAGYLPPAAGWALRLLPWAAVLLLGLQDVWRGLLLWLNCILQSWNTLHEGGVRLFAVEATARSVLVVSLAAGIACGQAAWRAVCRRRMLLAVQLVCGTFSPLGCALLLASELMLWMCVPERAPSTAAFWLGLACTAVLCALALLLPQTRLPMVDRLRKEAAETVRALRYGASTLPEGDLLRAAMLGQGEDTQLIVTSGQEKTLYLRAFVGDRYENGVWTPLPDAVYTGRYDGMLDWLREQGFDPLEQTATYFALTGSEAAPEENRVTVETAGASRAYLYAPGSTQALRAHGIPARYVEGYRLAADALARSSDGTVTLTGADTHAWCEVYFDGAGWQPVDFMPGYYYDARTLEQLIAAPESVQKTAALEQDAAREELADIPSVSGKTAADILAQAGRGLLLMLGVLAALVILLTIILLGLELARLIVLGHERAAFRRADGARQVRFLSQRIFLLLRLRSFDATLGWHAEQTDAILSSSLASIEPGEYARASELMEKSLYGGQELEQFELRAAGFCRPACGCAQTRARRDVLVHPLRRVCPGGATARRRAGKRHKKIRRIT